ncbi:hypothetical protein FACS189493_6180 [Spirochaetia bacterium]|nr:hypothetical protein FACS189493_6180 [Spirochaetia bacterium]
MSCANQSFVYTDKVVNYYSQHNRNTSGKISIISKLKQIISTKNNEHKIPERLYQCNALLERLPNYENSGKNLSRLHYIHFCVVSVKVFIENIRK